MPRRSKEDAQKTRTRILASALSAFVKKGYEHTTFTDIAARLKMTKGAIYWHFESKEALLIALVKMALAKFQRQIESFMPAGELTFLGVAEMMVADAASIVSEPEGAAFFRLMKCQIKWTDASMESVRKDLLSNIQFGPKEAFRRGITNDIAAGRVKDSVDAEEVSTVAIALWDGLVQARIDHFLDCDLETTLRHSYEAIWRQIQVESSPNMSSKEQSK